MSNRKNVRKMPHDRSRHRQPTAARYLGRVSNELICGRCAKVRAMKQQRIADLKKQAMAQQAEPLLAAKDCLRPVLAPVARSALGRSAHGRIATSGRSWRGLLWR